MIDREPQCGGITGKFGANCKKARLRKLSVRFLLREFADVRLCIFEPHPDWWAGKSALQLPGALLSTITGGGKCCCDIPGTTIDNPLEPWDRLESRSERRGSKWHGEPVSSRCRRIVGSFARPRLTAILRGPTPKSNCHCEPAGRSNCPVIDALKS